MIKRIKRFLDYERYGFLCGCCIRVPLKWYSYFNPLRWARAVRARYRLWRLRCYYKKHPITFDKFTWPANWPTPTGDIKEILMANPIKPNTDPPDIFYIKFENLDD